jgi:hypothetical protein
VQVPDDPFAALNTAFFRDGAAIAHLGNPDMRVPISYALTYPERAATPVPPLELRTLEFHEPDLETFRMRGHEEASGTAYVPPALFDEWRAQDPIARFERLLDESGTVPAAARAALGDSSPLASGRVRLAGCRRSRSRRRSTPGSAGQPRSG